MSASAEARITGHLQVKGAAGQRKFFAHWTDANGVKRTRTLGRAHVKDSGRRTPRGAVVWRAADGPCPAGAFTPKTAEDALAALLEEARHAPPAPRVMKAPAGEPIPTFGDAAAEWLRYLELEKRRKASTLQDARNTVRGYLLPHFGADTRLYSVERHEVVVMRGGRQVVEVREDRRDTFTTEHVDAFRRELLASHLAPRSAQKILVLLHALFKLAKRRKLIQSSPSEDAERVSITDPGTFNILEPVEFEAVCRALATLEDLTVGKRAMYAAMLSTTFYAGLRLGELLDLPWHCVDFDRSLIRVESGFTHGNRSTPKGKRARSTPMVPVLAQRLAELSTRLDFVGESDYVFGNQAGQRVRDANARAVFYAALDRASFAHKRNESDQHGNAQAPIRLHDLRHSWCTWAVNVWPVTKVQLYAGHRDIQTTMRYVHHQTKAEDADLGGAYLERVLSPPVPV